MNTHNLGIRKKTLLHFIFLSIFLHSGTFVLANVVIDILLPKAEVEIQKDDFIEIIDIPIPEEEETETPEKTTKLAARSHKTEKEIIPKEKKPTKIATKPKPAPPETIGTGEPDKSTSDVSEEVVVDLNTTRYKYASYFAKMRKKIARNWKYPKESQRKGEEGNVKIVFVIQNDGELVDFRINESSGHRRLDNGIRETIRHSSPFGPFPKTWNEKRVKIPAKFEYKLSKSAGRRVN